MCSFQHSHKGVSYSYPLLNHSSDPSEMGLSQAARVASERGGGFPMWAYLNKGCRLLNCPFKRLRKESFLELGWKQGFWLCANVPGYRKQGFGRVSLYPPFPCQDVVGHVRSVFNTWPLVPDGNATLTGLLKKSFGSCRQRLKTETQLVNNETYCLQSPTEKQCAIGNWLPQERS